MKDFHLNDDDFAKDGKKTYNLECVQLSPRINFKSKFIDKSQECFFAKVFCRTFNFLPHSSFFVYILGKKNYLKCLNMRFLSFEF